MDETTQSRNSDAAATRKRRSSILKSQRPARTPFSELEFHVATPTDTTKSRRVSFSRRTGVAEFVTNEATTTWKNFYEEHNKSLESSGNESGGNISKQPLGHIGKRIFDQQFEEVAVVDFMGSQNPGFNINSSISNINFAQLTSIECTDDLKLPAPQSKFELSTFTNNHSKIFGNDYTAPGMGELSDRIDINFSAVQQIGDKDDLDVIQKDIQTQRNFICHGPQNLSEYIEIDLNSTHAVVQPDESDVSITDVIRSPKVQEVSKSVSIEKVLNNWEQDKENIAINPYITPKESTNFAINEEPDKVLVFDGKRLTIQSETVPINRQTTPSQINPSKPQRKTIVLNVNDDLPNFINDTNASGYLSVADLKKHAELDTSMSITNPMTKLNDTQKQNTLVFDENCDISLTQAVSSNIVQEKRRTIVFEDATSNISITQSVPTNIVNSTDRRRTILYENDNGNISITQALPAQLISNERRNTIVYEDEDCNISMTQALPANIITEEVANKRKTIVFDNSGNLSITQAVPNIVISVRSPEKAHPSEDGFGNMSITQAIPSNIIIKENNNERRRTVVFESDACNMSVTQAVSSNVIYSNIPNDNIPVHSNPNILSDNDINRRKTIVFDHNTGNMSITKAVSSNVISNLKQEENKRNTIVFNDVEPDISMTEAENKISNKTNQNNTIIYKDEEAEMSVVQAIDQILSGFDKTISQDMPEDKEKRRTIVFDDENADISMTEVVDRNEFVSEPSNISLHLNTVKKTDNIDISMTEVVSTEEEKSIALENDVCLVNEEPNHQIACNKSKNNEILDISMSDEQNDSQDIKKEFNLTKDYQMVTPAVDNCISKPIPHELSLLQDEILEKSMKQYYKTAKNKVLDHTANVSQVLVYQIAQNMKQNEMKDSKIQPPVLIPEAKETSETKIDGQIESEELVVKIIPPQPNIDDEVLDINKKTDMEVEMEPNSSILTTTTTTNINKDEKSEPRTQEVQITKTVSEQSLKVVDVPIPKPKVIEKASLLNELLDMSKSSLEEKPSEYIKTETYIEKQGSIASVNKEGSLKEKSNDTLLFYITKDSDEEGKKEVPQLETVTPLPLEYKEESNPPIVTELQKKLNLLKSVLTEDIHQSKKSPRKSPVPDKLEEKHSSIDKDLNLSKSKNSFQQANNTNELFNMISDLTDKRGSRTLEPTLEVEEKPEPILIKGHLAIENKNDTETQSKRISFAPTRRSIILSREDLLNNISMASAVLQKSKLEFDENETIDDTTNTSSNINVSTKNTIRLSNDVIKTLQFEEDSDTEVCETSVKKSLLRKTAFGETSYMTENKAKVIPRYLNVTDELKELMDDLVKPMVDNIPFDAGIVDNTHKKVTSTTSVQVQANIITSSQVDLHTETYSNAESMYDLPDTCSSELVKDSIERSISRSLKSPIKSVITPVSEKSFTPIPTNEISPNRVIVFDQHNPLNNILLPPLEHVEAHKYNPVSSCDTISVSDRSGSTQTSMHQFSDIVSTQMNVETTNECWNYPKQTLKSESKQESIDRCENTVVDIKDTEVNTVIVMKGNKELLEVSSSLTLVDDGMFHTDNLENKESPVQLLYKVHKDELPEKDSDMTSSEDFIEARTKAKKRIYSPAKGDREKHKYCTLATLDVTPKPLTKMQKISEGSFKQEIEKPTKLKAEKDDNKTISKNSSPTKRGMKQIPSPKHRSPTRQRASPPQKTPPQQKTKDKVGTKVTVQQLITEFKMSEMNQKALGQHIKAALNTKADIVATVPKLSNSDFQSVEMVSSFTSSKNLGRDDRSHVTSLVDHRLSNGSGMEWQENDEFNTMYFEDCVSSSNIVAKIDMLPFMGSHECEWELSIGDTWAFRLLHSCLRLIVKLQHRHENATRTCVRADTPVLHTQIETIHTEKKNPIAVLCVRFASEAMRFEVSRGGGCRSAGDVPALVRRCAAAARLATRWARAMHDTRARLSYALTHDGILALKVANIPLRSVWEVRLKIELVVSAAGCAPSPRATPLATARVLAERHLSLSDIKHLVKDIPDDWGHVPKTIWRIFRYLKHKKKEDEFLELNY